MATSQQDVIKKFMESLDNTNLSGTNAVDEAIQACSNSKFNSAQAVINQMISYCANASSADDFLKNYCDIDLNNNDTGAITGLDAGGDTVKTAESIVPEVGSLKTYTNNSFTVGGLKVELVTLRNGNFSNHYKSTTYSNLTTTQKYIWNALYTWWIPNALELITESYGNNFGFGSDSSATIKTLHVGFYADNSNALAFISSWANNKGVTTDLDFRTNMKFYTYIDTSDANGSALATQLYYDRNVAHEMTHAVMAANICDCNNLPKIILEGMAELTHGIDDFRTADIKTLAGNSSLLKQALTLSTNLNSVSGVNSPDYAGGYMFLRYLAKQCANTDDDTDFEFTEYADNYSNYTANTVLSALGGNDTIKNYSSNVTIYGGAGKDYIENSSGKVKIYGGAGNDTILSGSGNDTMTGGKGKDLFIYTAGNDVITDYAEQDKIKIVGGEISAIKYKNKNIILTIGDGTLTVKNANGKNISVITANNSSNIAELFTEDNFTAANNFDDIVENKSVGDIEFSTTQDTISANITFAN